MCRIALRTRLSRPLRQIPIIGLTVRPPGSLHQDVSSRCIDPRRASGFPRAPPAQGLSSARGRRAADQVLLAIAFDGNR